MSIAALPMAPTQGVDLSVWLTAFSTIATRNLCGAASSPGCRSLLFMFLQREWLLCGTLGAGATFKAASVTGLALQGHNNAELQRHGRNWAANSILARSPAGPAAQHGALYSTGVLYVAAHA